MQNFPTMFVTVFLLIAISTAAGQTQFTPQELEQLAELSDTVCDVPLSCNRTSNMTDMCRCSCDESCKAMAECCLDSSHLVQSTNQESLSSFPSTCHGPTNTGKEYFVVSNCQREFACGLPNTLRNFIWMTHKQSGTIYRSEACAACHMVDQANLLPWKVHVTGSCEHTSRVIEGQGTTAPTTTKREFTFVGKPDPTGKRKKRALRIPLGNTQSSTTETSNPELTTVNQHDSQMDLFTRLGNYTLDSLLDMLDNITKGTESMVDNMMVSLDALLNRLHAYDVSDCSYVMTPPVDPYPVYHECSGKVKTQRCFINSHAAPIENFALLEQACLYFNTPFMNGDVIYKNVFCYLCNADVPQTSTESSSRQTVGVGETTDVTNDVTNVTYLYSGARDELFMIENLGFLVLVGLLITV